MDDYESFKKDVFAITTIDLNAYKEKQMKRRIDTLIMRHNIKGYKAFADALRTDKAILEEFVNYLTINVSEFYRNPDQWKILRETCIPKLTDRFGKRIKIWSAACSTGDEPYSLTMVFREYMQPTDFSIYATDIDKQVLAQADAGVYPKKSLIGLPKEFQDKYFTKITDMSYKVDPGLKKNIRFERHNLLKDRYPTGLSLIICRNVLIYFTEEAKDEIFKKFYDALAPGGILFLGATEQMSNYKEVGFDRQSSFFFEKPLK